ncbi:30S ribosome-binding factor RbfA [Chloroflexota bacterium]
MSRRIERVNSLIRDEISVLLQRQVKDPRLGGFISVTVVETSADLKSARIFVSRIGEEADKKAVMGGLAAATGFLRSELAKRLNLRRVPELSFQWDDSIERGDRLLRLIDEVSTENPSAENNG